MWILWQLSQAKCCCSASLQMGWLPTQLAQTVLSEENVCLERDCCSIEAILCMQFVNTSEKQSPSALIESDWIWSFDRPRQVGDEEEHDTEGQGAAGNGSAAESLGQSTGTPVHACEWGEAKCMTACIKICIFHAVNTLICFHPYQALSCTTACACGPQ